MLTQCPQCKKTYSISIEELKTRSTLLYCPNCEEMLGRLHLFKTDFFAGKAASSTAKRFFNLWLGGFLACLTLFAGQLYWLKRHEISQNPQHRIWQEKLCHVLHCHLPVYKNLDEFEVLHGDFQLVGNHYEFEAVFSNQADFAQRYPRIRLNLLDFNGQPFAERIFYPHEYLNDKNKLLMPATESIEVHLNIALPSQKVGGYTFDLL